MRPTLVSIRIFFLILCIIFMVSYTVGTTSHPTTLTFVSGILLGLILGSALIGIDLLFRHFSVSAFNTLSLGLFFGALLGFALLLIFNAIIDVALLPLRKEVADISKILLFLGSSYLGVIVTFRYSSELALAIPFLRLSSQPGKLRELLLDTSVLSDGRIVDIAATGLLDGRLVIPRFIMKELQEMTESKDETLQAKGSFSLEVIRRLEMTPLLHLKFIDTDFSEIKGSREKILRLARLNDTDLLTCEMNRVEMTAVEGVRIINLQNLACALKPLMQRGNFIPIKIQRLGKEERQGVGYLEDGTMVVVNGGGDYVGETIKACVLSVKHTTAGRMIFCNVSDDNS